MKDDPIVEEARQAGQAYIDSFHGDWKAIIADLNRRAQEESRRLVAPPARPSMPDAESNIPATGSGH